MKHIISLFYLLLAGIFFLLSFTQMAFAAGAVNKPKWVGGEAIIKFKKDVNQSSIHAIPGSRNINSLHRYRFV